MIVKKFDWLKWVLLIVFIIVLAVLIKILITGEPR